MGLSYTRRAYETLARWEALCRADTGSTNAYTGTDGKPYFVEWHRTEHRDGHMTGTAYRDLGPTCRSAGAVYINPDGTVRRWPPCWPFRKATDPAAQVSQTQTTLPHLDRRT